MRVVAVIPMRHDSERVPGKNYRPLGGRPLYRHIVATLSEVSTIDRVIIDTDSPMIIEDARLQFPEVEIVLRPENLRDGETAMNDVLMNTLSDVHADTVLQTHSTNPFLTSTTIADAIERYFASPDSDSLFSVSRIQARLWDGDTQPLNHDPHVLLRTQDLAPVFLENSCLYLFERAGFFARRNRIGQRPMMYEINGDEAIDIDVEADFLRAELVCQQRASAAR